MKTKTIIAIVMAILITIFSLQNAEMTDIKFLFWKLSLSRVLIILGSFAFGIVVGLLISLKKNRLPK
ncbi:LapA family protein [Cellulophaga sp. E16_2]|uniref:Lipopolysaccharide assembly protein A domain-containing protein n=1 Tax=Cellulophaga algicola (strain DSM 14237 / IC166 / ACAM 630) TaxID=688270 RepID=E6XCU4_CELAD|nr:hypothetical protein Celal_2804 [Cellulophaga algicola DSM 14237]MBO0592459.1 LapA family protein [Cellulophaga sp. E16_2]